MELYLGFWKCYPLPFHDPIRFCNIFAISVDHHHIYSSNRFSIALYCAFTRLRVMQAICMTGQHTETVYDRLALQSLL